MHGLMRGLPNSRRWRRALSEEAQADGAGPEVLVRALQLVREEPAA